MIDLINEENTAHMQNLRAERERFIQTHLGEGNLIAYFVVDRNHKNGKEVHYIFDNAIIEICNLRTGKTVTKLIGRIGQLLRYARGWNGQVEQAYDANGNQVPISSVKIPKRTIDLARRAEAQGWNFR